MGCTSGDLPFIIGTLPWNQGHWVTFPVSGPNDPMAKWTGLVLLLMPTNCISVRSLITSHFCWWCHLSSCVDSSHPGLSLLPPLTAVNLPTNMCCAGQYLVSTPPLPPHTELVTCRSVAQELSGVHFRRSAIHHWDITMESRTLGNLSSVWAQ